MRHLTDVEFVDLLDGRLPIGRRDHASACDACRSRADALRAALAEVPRDPVPEPSPLFWAHFSARIAEATGREPAPRRTWRSWMFLPAIRWPVAAAIVIVLAALSINVLVPRDESRPAAPGAPATTADFAVSTDAWLGDPDSDEAWAVVQTAADDLKWDDVQEAGIEASPGSVEDLAMELTEEERLVLARLIEDELRRTGS